MNKKIKVIELLNKIDKANKMTFDCINNCYIYEDCDGNRISITKEEQRIIDDYISPVKHIDWKKVKELRLDRRKIMSSFLVKNEKGKYVKEIESMYICKWKINEICCNDKSRYLADYPSPFCKCESKEDCEYFEKEEENMLK